METLKFRYTWKRIEDGHIYQTITPIECLEGKGDIPFLGNKLWTLVARDMFVKTDKDGNDIFVGDKFEFELLEALHEPTKLTGSFVWNQDELRYEIDIDGDEDFTSLYYVGNGIMRKFKLIQ